MALIFRETDKRTRRVYYDKYYTEPIEEDTDLVNAIEYAASRKIIKDRLELLGYKLEMTIEEYDKQMQEKISWHKEFGFDSDHTFKHLEDLSKRGFWWWVENARKVIKDGITSYNLDSMRDRSKDDIYIFIVDHYDEDSFLGYPSANYGLALRAILEAIDETDELVLDITSLVSAGYYQEDEPVCLNTIDSEQRRYLPFQKVLILTEGSTDTHILSRSLKLLYPHLYDYFSFMDFSSTRPDGGTSALERTVKSFAAAGLNNKIIALFDNDTTGLSSLNALKKTKLPTNIRLLALPELEFAKQYPTIGPQGVLNADINGRACSIELYLGENILRDAQGNFIPVRWSSLDSRQNDYQGEITQKTKIQEDFKQKITQIENGNSKSDSHQWENLRQIFQMIFKETSLL